MPAPQGAVRRAVVLTGRCPRRGAEASAPRAPGCWGCPGTGHAGGAAARSRRGIPGAPHPGVRGRGPSGTPGPAATATRLGRRSARVLRTCWRRKLLRGSDRGAAASLPSVPGGTPPRGSSCRGQLQYMRASSPLRQARPEWNGSRREASPRPPAPTPGAELLRGDLGRRRGGRALAEMPALPRRIQEIPRPSWGTDLRVWHLGRLRDGVPRKRGVSPPTSMGSCALSTQLHSFPSLLLVPHLIPSLTTPGRKLCGLPSSMCTEQNASSCFLSPTGLGAGGGRRRPCSAGPESCSPLKGSLWYTASFLEGNAPP